MSGGLLACSARHGISMLDASPSAESGNPVYFEVVTTQAGYHVRTKDTANRTIFRTSVYETEQSAIDACEYVKRYAASAPIRFVTE